MRKAASSMPIFVPNFHVKRFYTFCFFIQPKISILNWLKEPIQSKYLHNRAKISSLSYIFMAACFRNPWFNVFTVLKISKRVINDKTKIPETTIESIFLGLTTSLINPKILIFFTSIFSQFITQDYSIYTKFGMALLAGIIDSTWYILVCYSVSIKVRKIGISKAKIIHKIAVHFKGTSTFCLTILSSLQCLWQILHISLR